MSRARFRLNSYGDLQLTIPRDILRGRDFDDMNDLREIFGETGRVACPDDMPKIPPWMLPYIRTPDEDSMGTTNYRRDMEDLEREAKKQREAQAERIKERQETERREAAERAENKRREAERANQRAAEARAAREAAVNDAARDARDHESRVAEREAVLANRDANNILLAEDKRDHIRGIARSVVESSPTRVFVETSGYRNRDQENEWEPHERGAIDYRSSDIDSVTRHAEAREISRNLGNRYVVIVEEVDGDSQLNSSYRGGSLVKPPYETDRKASGTHTHIQPDRWWQD